jgi:ribonucleotide reductase beta subunit family protein with ferritin-like domain
MSITQYREAYKTEQGFEYPWAFEAYQKALGSVWRPEEVSFESDIRDWQNASQDEREVVGGILRGFTQLECHVSDYWSRIPEWFPKHEIAAVARAFSFSEIVHAHAYNLLSDTLGLNEFEAFLGDPIAQQKIGYFLEDRGIKSSLAVFSGAGEGVSLFSSFSVLLSLNLSGKYRALAQIISWSIQDEQCVDGGTEFLTPAGWKKMSDYVETDQVAQFDPVTKSVSFVNPTAYIHKQSDEMYEISKERRFSQYVTPGHTVVDYREGDMELRKTTAEKWSARQSYIPVSGYLENAREINALDRFMIALQADGCIRRKPSKREVSFSFNRKRKIERFCQLANELVSEYGFSCNEYPENKAGMARFSLLVPDEYLKYRSKFFDEVYSFTEIPKGFLEEVLQWDGHKPHGAEDSIDYSSKEKRNVEFVQTVAGLSGYYGHIFIQDDARWEKFCRQYRIYLKKEDVVYGRHSEKKYVSLDEPIDVFCFKVPTQAFLIRRNGLISVTGNCHSDTGIRLFRELVKEDPLTPEETQDIIQGFDAVIENEFAFIGKIFGGRSLKTVSPADLRNFILHRANNRLAALGIQKEYSYDRESAGRIKQWFDAIAAGATSTDFFSQSKSGDSYIAKPTQDFTGVNLKTLDLVLK